eukprot:TRINITY_DN1475_c0_g1_i7.p1 TRINITY_DN1475_c0_g1~~TRINITY_DN1475_c0_g1_i7.p1  ORF type:complete len:258 (+),score=29.80 TRINITY_DN1475_c0_g1_i7:382-1155(+)
MTVKVGAEFLGTFILIFAATATPIVNQKTNGAESLIGLAASSGLAVMVVILSTGHISGAHINPCLTISFAALRHFPWIQARRPQINDTQKLNLLLFWPPKMTLRHFQVPAYLAAQLLGSISAAYLLKLIFHPFMAGGVTVPSGSYAQAFALEFIISFNLMFVVTSVATDTRAVGELAGIAVGATVIMNILIAGPNSGAAMNPVRTLGPAIAARNFKAIWVYLTAPILGALCGAAAYTAVKLKDEQENQTRPTRSFRR